MNDWEAKRVLITVRTYPAPSRQSIEVSCTAGITSEGQWIRLYPIPYRHMPEDQRFTKYQWVSLSARKASDPRVESYRPNLDTLRIESAPLGNQDAWAAKRSRVFPLKAPSMCGLQAQRDLTGSPTLGFIKPTIERLEIIPVSAEWTPDQLAALRQFPLFATTPSKELEKIPFKFVYHYKCAADGCAGHEMSCTDWEMMQSWRNWSESYGASWEAAFRNRYEREMIEKYDTHFYVGTLRANPNAWIVIGLWYAPYTAQAQLI